MENELVKMVGSESFCDSRMIAEKFSKNHQYILQRIDKLKADLEDLRCKQNCTLKKKNTKIFKEKEHFYRGQTFRYIEMNRPAFSLLCMRFTGKKALEWQDKFNDAFYQMEHWILNCKLQQSNLEWKREREQGKDIRLELTDTIQVFIDYAIEQGSKGYSKNPSLCYVNYTKMQYKALSFIEKNEKVSKNFRNTLDRMDLSTLLSAERVAKKAIMEGMNRGLHYKDVFQLAKQKVEQLADIMIIPTTTIKNKE